jgi:hypothetical protein
MATIVNVLNYNLYLWRECGILRERERPPIGPDVVEPGPASQGPTGISLPTNTGGPDGWPVGEPPGGSTVTA